MGSMVAIICPLSFGSSKFMFLSWYSNKARNRIHPGLKFIERLELWEKLLCGLHQTFHLILVDCFSKYYP
jgi:hypothetical protein